MRKQAFILGLAAAILMVSAWLFIDARGIVAVGAGIVFGWMMRHLAPRTPTAAAVSSPNNGGEERVHVLEVRMSSLRHDLRGILSPALLTAERLLGNEDPLVRRAGEVMVKTVERASGRLAESKGSCDDVGDRPKG